MKNNKKSVKVKIIGAILTLLVIVISVLLLDKNSTISLWKILGIDTQKELAQGIRYQIYKYTDGTGKMLITFRDDESGIASISLNNTQTLQCNKNIVATDYDISENSSYVFKMRLKNGREVINNITIDEDFLQNNGIKMTNTKPDTANYKVIKLTYSLIENKTYRMQYKVESNEWRSCEDSFAVFDYDVKDMADANEEVRVYVRAINTSNENEIIEVSKKYKVDISATTSTIEGDSLLSVVESDDFFTGTYQVKINGVTYGVHAYEQDGNQTWTSNMEFGAPEDVGTKTSYAQNMVIVKVNGDLTVNKGVTISTYYTEYGGPKGLLLYVTGKLINNGTIDNSHGAYAEGQDVYLWKNADGSYEYVPASGGVGGTAKYPNGSGNSYVGGNGTDGTNRSTGGGGSGGSSGYGLGSFGTQGTSYSGGTGGGGSGTSSVYSGPWNAGSASTNGGKGGNAGGTGNSGGGAGNPGGTALQPGTNGLNGTGGLLIIYSDEWENNGKVTCEGSGGGSGYAGGGGSGGGSINIFTNQPTGVNQIGIEINSRYSEILGSYNISGGTNTATVKGGTGGTGTLNIGEIRDGNYYDLKDCINQDQEKYINSVTKQGDSILSLLNDDSLTTGYYYFGVNEEKYPVHLYVYDGNQTFTTNETFGDENDVSQDVPATNTDAAYRSYAQNMVIVKINGDLTISEGVTVGPYYTEYGGPKGFLLYVTGKLTNNGTIDNSHGAYAEGQDVYLWKNADGTYEYVPAAGSAGGTAQYPNSSGRSYVGGNGTAGTNRGTGGGGSGGSSGYGFGSAGTQGTSYSGGTGGGGSGTSSVYSGPWNAGSASTNGGKGGKAGGTGNSGGGAGNPGGTALSPGTNGSNGTGGLLLIYSNEWENNGKVTCEGSGGGSGYASGGGSGGGSINVFYKNLNTRGELSAAGGTGGITVTGGIGGAGDVTIGNISTGTFVEN